jgi:anti-sigma B factor antagonist
MLGRLNPPNLVIDFHETTHIGSAGIGKLLLFYKDMAANDGKVRLENLSRDLYEMFTALKLDTVFTILRT